MLLRGLLLLTGVALKLLLSRGRGRCPLLGLHLELLLLSLLHLLHSRGFSGGALLGLLLLLLHGLLHLPLTLGHLLLLLRELLLKACLLSRTLLFRQLLLLLELLLQLLLLELLLLLLLLLLWSGTWCSNCISCRRALSGQRGSRLRRHGQGGDECESNG